MFDCVLEKKRESAKGREKTAQFIIMLTTEFRVSMLMEFNAIYLQRNQGL
jgi:hypothetical protein